MVYDGPVWYIFECMYGCMHDRVRESVPKATFLGSGYDSTKVPRDGFGCRIASVRLGGHMTL